MKINHLFCTGLPDELIQEIFEYISIKEIVRKSCYVNKKWNKISNASVLWRDVILNESDITRLEEKDSEKIEAFPWIYDFSPATH